MDGVETEEMSGPTFPKQGSSYQPLPRSARGGRVVSHAVQTIRSTPEQVFHVYTRPELLPSWQEGVVSVVATSNSTQHWAMQDPGTGEHLEYDAEITEFVPGKRLKTRVLNGSFAGTTDTVLFEEAPAGRGTQVTVTSEYHLPGGIVTDALSTLFTRSPEQLTIENLRHLKQLIESREIPSVEGQPAGPRGIVGRWKRLLFGENLPVPPGTSDHASPRDLAEANRPNDAAQPLLLSSVAVAVGLAAWCSVRYFLSNNKGHAVKQANEGAQA